MKKISGYFARQNIKSNYDSWFFVGVNKNQANKSIKRYDMKDTKWMDNVPSIFFMVSKNGRHLYFDEETQMMTEFEKE